MTLPIELSLLERTRCMYEDALNVLTAKQIAAATGLSESWLSRWLNGKIVNPGILQIQRLHDYLQGIDAK